MVSNFETMGMVPVPLSGTSDFARAVADFAMTRVLEPMSS